VVAGMPDAVHNAPDDYVYFIINADKKSIKNISHESFEKLSVNPGKDECLIYGISCFK